VRWVSRLSAYGIPQPVINPSLLLTKPSGEFVAANDDWQNAPWASDIERHGFPPGNNFEAAIFINLAPGAYTAIVDSGSSGAGTASSRCTRSTSPLRRSATSRHARASARGSI
jgi:hypothetical protein